MLGKIDWNLLLLFFGTIIFAGLTIYVNFLWPNDGQIFTIIGGGLTGFLSSFFTYINARGGKGGKEDGKDK